MMSSNTTDYDANWRFQLDYSSLFNVKISTEEGDLVVTNNNGESILSKIDVENINSQRYVLCEDCPEDWCSV